MTTSMLWIFPLIFAVFSYFFIDKELALYLNDPIFSLKLFKFFSFLIAPLNQLILWSLITIIALYRQFKDHLKSAFTILLTILTYMFIAGVLKIIIGRARPLFFIETGFYGFSFLNGHHSYFRSFPSSHAATAFALTHLFTRDKKPLFKKLSYLFAAVLVSSRLFLKEHYLSDLIIGGMIGMTAAKLALYFALNKIEQALKLARFIFKRP